MYPVTPPNSNLSRSKLKQLATWIRDDLDLLVAREGPNILRPDDVLALNEVFLALRQAHHITILDLRATGIHRAVQDIAGVATRWPGRLCDDCDKIVAVWTVKFGPLSDLHPFLYGRGGRLEGIASVTEYSREALLKRWAQTCPEKIHPMRSHRLGDLNFRAGSWWINPLFAYHAGIIGFESVEGGTTYDKDGAYALVLKDHGETDAISEKRFTYRCLQNDKGKFRLTSAVPKSREPIRVLRSHSVNSVWGPKAGIRYEGMYAVKGWSIHQAKTTDTAGGQWREGDIVFDIRLERVDRVPMDEVIKRPTALEVDDYSEYKRLRKVFREGKREDPTAPIKTATQPAAKAAPSILPWQPSPTMPKTPPIASLSTPRKSMFRRPHFDQHSHVHFSPGQDVVSPMTVPDTDQFGLSVGKSSNLKAPAQLDVGLPDQSGVEFSPNDNAALGSQTGSKTNTSHTSHGSGGVINIKDVAPWIDFDASLTIPPAPNSPSTLREDIDRSAQKGFSGKDSPTVLGARRESKKSGEFRGITSYTRSPNSMKRDARKSIFVRGRNPMSRLLDGPTENAEEPNDYFGRAILLRTQSVSAGTATPKVPYRERAISLAGTVQVRSPTLMQPITPDSPLNMARRDAICPANDLSSLLPRMPLAQVDSMATLLPPREALDDPFVEGARVPTTLPFSLKNLISRSRTATMVSSESRSSVATREESKEENDESPALQTLKKVMQDIQGVDIKVAFRNPFKDARRSRRSLARVSSSVPPDVVT